MRFTFTGQNLMKMASRTIEAFRDRRVRLYKHDDLEADLKRLRIEEKEYGYRLTSPRSAKRGHGDLATAFALAVMVGDELAGQRKLVVGGESVHPGRGYWFGDDEENSWQAKAMQARALWARGIHPDTGAQVDAYGDPRFGDLRS